MDPRTLLATRVARHGLCNEVSARTASLREALLWPPRPEGLACLSWTMDNTNSLARDDCGLLQINGHIHYRKLPATEHNRLLACSLRLLQQGSRLWLVAVSAFLIADLDRHATTPVDTLGLDPPPGYDRAQTKWHRHWERIWDHRRRPHRRRLSECRCRS